MASVTSVKFDASHHAVIALKLLVLGTLVLPLARLPLLKLQEQGAPPFLPSCARNLDHFGSCHPQDYHLNLDHFSTDLHRKGGCARIAATS